MITICLLLRSIITILILRLISSKCLLMNFYFHHRFFAISGGPHVRGLLFCLFSRVIHRTTRRYSLQGVNCFKYQCREVRLHISKNKYVLPISKSKLPLLRSFARPLKGTLYNFACRLTTRCVTSHVLSCLHLFFAMIANRLKRVLRTRASYRLITSNNNCRVIGAPGVCHK